jgi:hypothetical protein
LISFIEYRGVVVVQEVAAGFGCSDVVVLEKLGVKTSLHPNPAATSWTTTTPLYSMKLINKP